MSTAKKSSFFMGLAVEAEAVLQLDPDIYTPLLSELGLKASKTSGARTIKCSLKVLGASGFAQMLRVSCAKGTNPETATEFRQLKIICDVDQVDTAIAGLIGKIIKLGYGTNGVDWVITRVN